LVESKILLATLAVDILSRFRMCFNWLSHKPTMEYSEKCST